MLFWDLNPFTEFLTSYRCSLMLYTVCHVTFVSHDFTFKAQIKGMLLGSCTFYKEFLQNFMVPEAFELKTLPAKS